MDSAREHWRQVNDEVRAELAKVRTRRMTVDGIDEASGMVRLADLDGTVWEELAPSVSPEPLGAGDDVLVAVLPAVGDRKARGSRFVLGKLTRSTAPGATSSTIANTTAQTAFASPAKAFAAGALAVTGRSGRVFGRGRWGVIASPSLTLRVQLTDGVTPIDLAVFTLLPSGGVTDQPFRFQVDWQFTSATRCAASGVCVYANGTTNVVALSDRNPAVLVGASPLSLRVTAQWDAAAAANTVTLGNGWVEVIA